LLFFNPLHQGIVGATLKPVQQTSKQVFPLTEVALGFGALIRWQHPLQGLLLPGKFISCIEDIATA